MDEIGPGSCPVVNFHINGAEPSGAATKVSVNVKKRRGSLGVW
jgi:hypothetical protein